MRKSSVIVVALTVILVSISSSFAAPLDDRKIEVTRNLSGEPLPTRAEYLALFPEREFSVEVIDQPRIHRDEEGTIALNVNSALYNTLEDQFSLWINDLEGEGYDVVLMVTEGGTALELKNRIIEESGEDLTGVIFCGELPLAWFEHLEYFRNEDEPDNQRLEEYPIDMFFMDLDGAWEDTSGNEIYDYHHGEVDPEIWLGRLPAYNLSRMDEVTVMSEYLDRIHAFRQGEITLPHRALTYIDDDWAGQVDRWTDDIRHVYGLVIAENDSNATSATGYREHLESDGYELVQVAVHSTSDSHSFFINNRSERDYFRFWDLRDEVVEQALFYNLFACSIMNFTDNHNLCMGVLYALGGPNGLGSVGSTKTGGMLFFDDYYRPLGEGANFGEALRSWLTDHAHDPESPNWARSWFYGMTHYGDPTLKIAQGLRVAETLFNETEGDHDQIPDVGEVVELSLNIRNRGLVDIGVTEVTLQTQDQAIAIADSQSSFNGVAAGEVAAVEGFSFAINEHLPDGYRMVLELRMRPEDGEVWWDQIKAPVRAPLLELAGYSWEELVGDGDGWLNGGEEGAVTLLFKNVGGDAMHNTGSIQMISLDSLIVLDEETGTLEPIETGQAGILTPQEFIISEDAPDQSAIYLRITSSINDYVRGSGICAIPLGQDFQFEDSLTVSPVWLNHYALTAGYRDVWQWQALAGEYEGVLAFGGPDTLLYPARCDAALELPLLMYDANAILEIYHRMDVEMMYDACVVEVDRGAGWQRVVPEAGYNGRSVEIGNYEGGDCWNGLFDWREDRIVLGGPAGVLRVRLRFASDAGVEGNGWFIDRIGITGTVTEVENRNLSPQTPMLVNVYPNPFNAQLHFQYSLPEQRQVSIVLFDLNGREVAQVVNNLQLAGRHDLTFQASHLASGIYLALCSLGTETQQQKLLLLK